MTDLICTKIPFETRNDAKPAAKSAEKKYGKKMHIYDCDKCGKFHLSSFSQHNISERDKLRRKGRTDRRVL